MKVKVCGMRDPANIEEIAVLGPDYMGFIFYEGSPRYAGGLDPGVVNGIPGSIAKVGVFVNSPIEAMAETVRRYGLDYVQLHGGEDPGVCSLMRGICGVIKAVGVGSPEDIDRACERYSGVCDFLLFDTKTPLYGGSGRSFDWSLLDSRVEAMPFFLSGGITPGDHANINALKLAALHAVDINSGFETAPGIKSPEKTENFIKKIKR